MASYLLSYYYPSIQAWRQVPITDQIINIGSAPDNNLILADNYISHHHASIFSDARGVWLMDQNSTNGIILNGQRLPVGQWVFVPVGANFTIGSAAMQVESVPKMAAAPKPAPSARPARRSLKIKKQGGIPLLPALIVIGVLVLCCFVVVIGMILGGSILGGGGAQPTTGAVQAVTPVGDQEAGSGGGDYVVRKTAPAETTPESTEGVTSGSATTLKLSDGTQLDLPASSAPVAVKLSRESNTIQPQNPALQTSGSMRVLEFDRSKIDQGFIPVLTIPAKEMGELALATVNVMRIGDVQVGGETIPDQVVHLPVTTDQAGNLVVVDTATATLAAGSASGVVPAGNRLAKPVQQSKMARVRFVVMTFQGHAQWLIAPCLVRMIPDASLPEFRRPADPVKDKERLLKPVVNVVVLVHGHNEEEKGGGVVPSAPEPWGVTYKREVWTELYKTYLEEKQDQLDCTAFYEFIYPTFRSAYSPIAGNPAEPLGDSLVSALNQGAANDEYQLEKMRKAKMPVNLYFTAHSMGGLVARAGITQFDGWLKDNFQQLVTWGTPHHGSPLVSFGYILRGPYETIHKEPVTKMLNTLMGSSALRWAQENWIQMDTPGTRDLRWDNIQEVNFSDQFRLIPWGVPRDADPNDYNLTNGAYLYNNNLTEFNRYDTYRDGNKYYFLYGVTQKEFADPFIFSATAQGAFLIRLFMKNPTSVIPSLNGVVTQSDGAVPLASMAGLYLVTGRSANVGNVDHEEYYSSSDVLYGGVVARSTFERLGLSEPRCKCAELNVTSSPAGGSVKVDAEFTLDPTLDKTPGKRIKTAEALYYLDANKNEFGLGDLSVAADGKLTGSFNQPDLGAGLNPRMVVRLFLADGTQLEGEEKNLGCSGVSEIQVSVPSFSTFDCKQEEELQVITIKIDVKKDGTVQRYGDTIYSHPQEVSGSLDASGNLTFNFKWVNYLEDKAGSEVTGTFTGGYTEGTCRVQGTASGEVHVWDQEPSYCKAYDQKIPYSQEMKEK